MNNEEMKKDLIIGIIDENLKEDICNLSLLLQEFFETNERPNKDELHFQYCEIRNKLRQLYKSMKYNSTCIQEVIIKGGVNNE